MGILSNGRKIMTWGIEASYCMGQRYGERKKIHDLRRRNLINRVTLSRQQKHLIDTFYKENYGRKIAYDWHRLYQSFTGKFAVDYFPDVLFSGKLEPLLDKNPYNDVLEDKNLLHIYGVCKNVRTPIVYASRCAGMLRNGGLEQITKIEFYDFMKNIGKVVIKPSVQSGSGRHIRFIKVKNGVDIFTGDPIEDIVEMYGNEDFVIQECVECSRDLSNIYPIAVNTFRIMTYILDGEIFACPGILRIGQKGSKLDNAHAGGMFIGIDDDGFLRDEAYTEFGIRYKEHPDTHLIYKGYKVSNYKKIIEKCKKLHAITPQLGFISWDMTLDKDEEIVLIEINTRGGSIWLSQMANGCGVFGDNTKRILKLIRV